MIDVPVKLGPRSYRVAVGAGLLAQVGPEISRLGVGRKLALLTDPAIKALYGEIVARSLAGAGFEVTTVLLPEGERAKTLEVAAQTWDRLLEAGLDRGSAVVALGGGAVGDLAGFVAATYMRGVHFVQLPTTLLAQVDASIGGKTAIDHPRVALRPRGGVVARDGGGGGRGPASGPGRHGDAGPASAPARDDGSARARGRRGARARDRGHGTRQEGQGGARAVRARPGDRT